MKLELRREPSLCASGLLGEFIFLHVLARSVAVSSFCCSSGFYRGWVYELGFFVKFSEFGFAGGVWMSSCSWILGYEFRLFCWADVIFVEFCVWVNWGLSFLVLVFWSFVIWFVLSGFVAVVRGLVVIEVNFAAIISDSVAVSFFVNWGAVCDSAVRIGV